MWKKLQEIKIKKLQDEKIERELVTQPQINKKSIELDKSRNKKNEFTTRFNQL